MKVILVTVLSIVFLCSGCSSNIKEEQKSIKICSSLNETMTYFSGRFCQTAECES
mgnify:CR=1 FL=1